jgi:beta-glucanase (GH16 family)
MRDIATANGDTYTPGEWDFIGHPFYLLFNLAVGGTSTGYGGGTDATTLNTGNQFHEPFMERWFCWLRSDLQCLPRRRIGLHAVGRRSAWHILVCARFA